MKEVIRESQVQRQLYHSFLSGAKALCPNYTPRGWWECDLWRVTKSGYSYEYEIKRSVSDFRNDRRKSRLNLGREESKHDLLFSKDERGPSYFYFVLPQGIVCDSEVSFWAGIIRYDETGHRVTRKAPKLHSVKVKESEINLAYRRMSFRYWDLKNSISRNQGENQEGATV